MEVGLDPGMPTYSGGLGVLAGDTLRAAADLGVPMVALTLLHRKGYFRQHLDVHGGQTETEDDWNPEDFLQPLEPRASVTVEGRPVLLRAWQYTVRGVSGHTVPVYFLDADLPDNDPRDRALTGQLYGGDTRYRLSQEVILGIGGLAMLRALRHGQLQTYHMNEGHAALLAIALLEEVTWGRGLESATAADFEMVRQKGVFTTHTPVPAGQDKFPLDLAREVLGEDRVRALERGPGCLDGLLNMTYLALSSARYVNGVALRHGEISRGMYPGYPIRSITNGVHAGTWISHPFQELFDREIPEWRSDNLYLRYAGNIAVEDVLDAHAQAKRDLLAEIQARTGVKLDRSVMTIGFARRAAEYKRAGLLFSDIEALRAMTRDVGPIQVVYAGKAHPRDEGGKSLIRGVFDAAEALRGIVPVVYLEGHDMALAKLLCSGVDLWLNTPQKPHEASGTSGMKAALNGVPSLSVPDGWWVEGWVDGVTGWCIGNGWENDPAREVTSLYNKLTYVILPLFYGRPEAYATVMRSTIAVNGSFFNAQRMVSQYVENAYRLRGEWSLRNGVADPTARPALVRQDR